MLQNCSLFSIIFVSSIIFLLNTFSINLIQNFLSIFLLFGHAVANSQDEIDKMKSR